MNSKDFKKLLLADEKIKNAFIEAEKNETYKIGRDIKKLRINKGWTQKEFAEKIGTKQPGIARIENGSECPNNETLKKIAKVTKTIFVPPHFLENSSNIKESSENNFQPEKAFVNSYLKTEIANFMTENTAVTFKEETKLNEIILFDACLAYC